MYSVLNIADVFFRTSTVFAVVSRLGIGGAVITLTQGGQVL